MGKCLYDNDFEKCEDYPKGCGFCFDAHSCRAEADAYGVCQWCGALVYGSPAYCEAHGCDPVSPEDYWNMML